MSRKKGLSSGWTGKPCGAIAAEYIWSGVLIGVVAIGVVTIFGEDIRGLFAKNPKTQINNNDVQATQGLDPYEDLFSEKEIKKKFVHLKTVPFGNQELAFGLLIPKGWQDTPLKVPPSIALNPEFNFVPLTLQTSPDQKTGPARIEVQYLLLQTELNLSDWVTHYLETHDLQVLSRARRQFSGRQVDDVVVRSGQKKEVYLARMTFSKHGARIFLVAGSSLANHFKDYAEIFGAASVSFRLKHKPKNEFAEPIRTYIDPGPPHLEFHYPASWDHKAAQNLPPGKVGVDIARKISDQTVGFIHVKAKLKSASDDPQLVLQKLKKDFEAAGVTLDKSNRRADLDSSQKTPLAKIDVWEAKIKGVPAEVATLVLENSQSYFSVGMLTPLRQNNPIAWMASWRVFEMVAGDIQRSLPEKTEATPRVNPP